MNQSAKVSEGLEGIINDIVKEVVLQGASFDSKKKWLKRYFNLEGVDYSSFEGSFPTLLEAFKGNDIDKTGIRGLARLCFVRTDTIDSIFDALDERRVLSLKKELEAVKEVKRSQQKKRKAESDKKEAERKEVKRKDPEEVDQSKDHTPVGVTAIDLGLPSGTKWASCNVGATKPWEYGGCYAWGETEEKKVYNRENYDKSAKKSKSICGTEYDVAHMKWGVMWKMPTKDQINELFDNCEIEWITLHFVNGSRFTSKINGNSIFFPAAGSRDQDFPDKRGVRGGYWSGTNGGPSGSVAPMLSFSSSHVYAWVENRHEGLSVRPVATE